MVPGCWGLEVMAGTLIHDWFPLPQPFEGVTQIKPPVKVEPKVTEILLEVDEPVAPTGNCQL
jgi:hypothetical protein